VSDVLNRVKLKGWRHRGELFDPNANYAVDARAMVHDWDQLQARYDHLPVFKEMIRRYFLRR
jgi:hypothetical protein